MYGTFVILQNKTSYKTRKKCQLRAKISSVTILIFCPKSPRRKCKDVKTFYTQLNLVHVFVRDLTPLSFIQTMRSLSQQRGLHSINDSESVPHLQKICHPLPARVVQHFYVTQRAHCVVGTTRLFASHVPHLPG